MNLGMKKEYTFLDLVTGKIRIEGLSIQDAIHAHFGVNPHGSASNYWYTCKWDKSIETKPIKLIEGCTYSYDIVSVYERAKRAREELNRLSLLKSDIKHLGELEK